MSTIVWVLTYALIAQLDRYSEPGVSTGQLDSAISPHRSSSVISWTCQEYSSGKLAAHKASIW